MKKIYTYLLALVTALPLVALAAPIPQTVRFIPGRAGVIIADPKTAVANAKAVLARSQRSSARAKSVNITNLEFYRLIPFITATASQNVDPNLVNPWGFTFSKEGNVVVSDNRTSVSTIYTPTGGAINFNIGTLAPVRPTLFITVPSNPSGVVTNPSKHNFEFKITGGNKKAADYIYCTEGGVILAYNRHVDPLHAVAVANRSSQGAVYKGLDIAVNNGNPFLYVADFHNGNVDVFDSHFTRVSSFTDNNLPNGYAPFNVRTFHNQLYVTYAKQLPPANVKDDPGAGHGYIVIFKPNGDKVKRLISQGELNSPWGLAFAPRNYGPFSNALLVGNFGDGFINAFNATTGAYIGKLFDRTATSIQIPGLWGLRFDPNTARPGLVFSSGPAAGTDGLVGTIQWAANDTTP